MLDLLSPSIRPDGDVAAKTTPAVTKTVAQRPNQSVVVFTVVKVFTLAKLCIHEFFISFILVSCTCHHCEIIKPGCKVTPFVDEASEPLQPKVAVYFAVATGLPFSSVSNFSRFARFRFVQVWIHGKLVTTLSNVTGKLGNERPFTISVHAHKVEGVYYSFR